MSESTSTRVYLSEDSVPCWISRFRTMRLQVPIRPVWLLLFSLVPCSPIRSFYQSNNGEKFSFIFSFHSLTKTTPHYTSEQSHLDGCFTCICCCIGIIVVINHLVITIHILNITLIGQWCWKVTLRIWPQSSPLVVIMGTESNSHRLWVEGFDSVLKLYSKVGCNKKYNRVSEILLSKTESLTLLLPPIEIETEILTW